MSFFGLPISVSTQGGQIYTFDGPTVVNADGSIGVEGTRGAYVENSAQITLAAATQVLMSVTITLDGAQVPLVIVNSEFRLASTADGGALGTLSQQILGAGINKVQQDYCGTIQAGAGLASPYNRGFISESTVAPAAGTYTIQYKASYNGSAMIINGNKGHMAVLVYNTIKLPNV